MIISSRQKDLLPGGLADNEPDSKFDPKELAIGTEDEGSEHTSSPAIAKEIAKDHLAKEPKYYSEMAKKEASIQISFRHVVAKYGTSYEWSCLMIDYPEDLIKKITVWGKENVPKDRLHDDKEDPTCSGMEDHIHTTVCYGLDPKVTLDDIKKKCNLGSLDISLGSIDKFEKDNYDVLKINVDSPDLHKLHKDIEDEIGAPGNTYSDYRPHITIAYVKSGSCDDLIGKTPFKGMKFEIDKYDFSSAVGKHIKHTAASNVPNPLRQNYDYSNEACGPEWQNRVRCYMKRRNKRMAALSAIIKNG